MDFSQAGHRAQGRKWLSITGRANSSAAPSLAAPSILPKNGGQFTPAPLHLPPWSNRRHFEGQILLLQPPNVGKTTVLPALPMVAAPWRQHSGCG